MLFGVTPVSACSRTVNQCVQDVLIYLVISLFFYLFDVVDFTAQVTAHSHHGPHTGIHTCKSQITDPWVNTVIMLWYYHVYIYVL